MSKRDILFLFKPFLMALLCHFAKKIGVVIFETNRKSSVSRPTILHLKKRGAGRFGFCSGSAS
ncbi:hypothetical protein D3C80_1574950 [compost metagenome]